MSEKDTFSQPATPGEGLLDVRQVSLLLKCSTRHVYRLSDAGRMPAPVRLGALVRWSKAAIESWITDGCPSCLKEVQDAK